MTTSNQQPTSNPFTLVRRLVSGGVALAKLEVQSARQEMSENLGSLKGGILKLVIAVAILVAVVIELIAFVVAVLVAAGLWWVALLIIVLLIALAGALAWSGVRQVRETKFTPEETIASVKEEIAWAKNRFLRRD